MPGPAGTQVNTSGAASVLVRHIQHLENGLKQQPFCNSPVIFLTSCHSLLCTQGHFSWQQPLQGYFAELQLKMPWNGNYGGTDDLTPREETAQLGMQCQMKGNPAATRLS